MLNCNICVYMQDNAIQIITARIWRMRECSMFSLFVSSPGRRGTPASGHRSFLGEGVPSPWSQVLSGGRGTPVLVLFGKGKGGVPQPLVPGPFWRYSFPRTWLPLPRQVRNGDTPPPNRSRTVVPPSPWTGPGQGYPSPQTVPGQGFPCPQTGQGQGFPSLFPGQDQDRGAPSPRQDQVRGIPLSWTALGQVYPLRATAPPPQPENATDRRRQLQYLSCGHTRGLSCIKIKWSRDTQFLYAENGNMLIINDNFYLMEFIF